jgi:hypothetical protein
VVYAGRHLCAGATRWYIASKAMKSRPAKSVSASNAIGEDLQSALVARFGDAVRQRDKAAPQTMSTGISTIDELTGGLPRGAMTEILGSASSGRTSLMLRILAEATSREEVCALVDATDSLDAASASNSGVDLSQLLWVRCGGNVQNALKAADLLLQSGGFGLVILDFGDVAAEQARKIQATWWYRFGRAVENTPTGVVVIEREPSSRSSAALVLELKKERARWPTARQAAEAPSNYGAGEATLTSPLSSNLLGGLRLRIWQNKPVRIGTREARIETIR